LLHLLFGIDQAALRDAFHPAFMEPLVVAAREVGLNIPSATVHPDPSRPRRVRHGADIVAGVLATSVVREDKLRVFVDVGTPTARSSSAARSGRLRPPRRRPAFEGSQIRCGMRATRRAAIEGVQLGEGVELQDHRPADIPPPA